MAFAGLSPDTINLITGLLAAAGAILGYLFGLQQYRKGQRWQKAQVLMSLMDSFEHDELIDAACQMLDWDDRRINAEGNEFRFQNKMLIQALRVVPVDSEEVFSPEDRAIRDSFDAFFDYFQRLYNFRQSNLLEFKDLSYFFYWLHLVEQIKSMKGEGDVRMGERMEIAITDYREKYKFQGFNKLLKEYQDYCRKHPTVPYDYGFELPKEAAASIPR